jgi:hypothetical protein
MPEALGPGHAASLRPLAPSAYWGEEKLWDTRANNHNAMFDKQGRVWMAATVRDRPNPAFCKKGSEHPSAKVFPLEMSSRQVAMLDPVTMKYTFIDTCFGTHHPQFGYDADNTLWLSGTGPVAGWVNTKVFEQSGDAAKAQGWSPFVPTPTATAGARVRRSQRHDRSDQGQTDQPGTDRTRDAQPVDGSITILVACSADPRDSCVSIRRRSCPRSTTCQRPTSASAAATSTRTAWRGDRPRAAISRASTGASAKDR